MTIKDCTVNLYVHMPPNDDEIMEIDMYLQDYNMDHLICMSICHKTMTKSWRLICVYKITIWTNVYKVSIV